MRAKRTARSCNQMNSWRASNPRPSPRTQGEASLVRAVERAGLLPASDCRRGNCLSCAARVLDGAPYSLQMKRDATSLCGEAHDDGVVLLCSAHAVGPGLRLQLGADGDAWEMQYRDRFDKKWEPPEPPEPPSSFMWPPA